MRIKLNKKKIALWVWTANPNGLAKTTTMQIEEPFTAPEEFYMHLGNLEMPCIRNGPVEMLDYAITIHLDRVLDYSPLPSSPSYKSCESNISG